MAEGVASMKNWTPYVIALLVVGYLSLSFVSQEYANIRNAIGETKAKTDAVADETKATMEAIKQTIEDLRGKFRLLETQMEARATEQKPDPKQASAPTIVMHSASWCGPCQKWKRESLPQWKAIGWTVDVVEDDAATQTVPWFEITDSDGVEFKVVGYMDLKAFETAKANAVRSSK
jgi:hypothetical protein